MSWTNSRTWLQILRKKRSRFMQGKLYVEYGLERELHQAGAEVYRPLAHMPGMVYRSRGTRHTSYPGTHGSEGDSSE